MVKADSVGNFAAAAVGSCSEFEGGFLIFGHGVGLGWLLLGSGDSQNNQGGWDDKKAENFEGGLECGEVLNHGENINRTW